MRSNLLWLVLLIIHKHLLLKIFQQAIILQTPLPHGQQQRRPFSARHKARVSRLSDQGDLRLPSNQFQLSLAP